MGHIKWIYGSLLCVALCLSASDAWYQSAQLIEYAKDCDAFGYLSMARSVREAFDFKARPDFTVRSSQTEELISFLKQSSLPVSRWEQAVAPHAFHYFDYSNQIAVQYPPGTALFLALFPESKAIQGLNHLTILTFLALGIVGIYSTLNFGAIASAGLVAFAAHEGFVILERIQHRSYSVNATLLPLGLSIIVLAMTRNPVVKRAEVIATILAFIGGLLSGFCVLIRIASFLQVPALFFFTLRSKRLFFLIGFCLTGLILLLFYQHDMSGIWFAATYASDDVASPTLGVIWRNVLYYLVTGSGAKHNWALLGVLIGFIGFHFSKKDFQGSLSGFPVGAILLSYLIPLIYFLTHSNLTPYYMILPIFCTVWMVTLSILVAEEGIRKNITSVLLSLLPGITVIVWGLVTLGISPSSRVQEAPPQSDTLLPSDLNNVKSWIWADSLSGTFWYYARKPAYKLHFSDTYLRQKIYQWIEKRNDSLFIVEDSDEMKTQLAGIQRLGGRPMRVGEIYGKPYYKIQW